MSANKQDEMKKRILQQEEQKKKDRDARAALMPSKGEGKSIPQPESKENVNVKVNDEELFTITIDPLNLRLKDPEQTFGMKANRTELIGCFFEPEVAKAFKADQKKKGRGWQSHLVNELIKQYYKDKGKL